ncbi:MAG: hypothetical protein QXE31_01580 [Candidatus Woesearchaeota archaeon]
MKIKPRHLILISIFFAYFLIRLYFTLQTNYFDDTDSYLYLKQIENIIKKGKPIFYDELSYGGRTFYFMPFYYYLIAIITKLFLLINQNLNSIILLKIINNFFASLLIIIVYLIIAYLEKNRNVALICSLLTASFPLYITETLNKLNYYSIIFSLFLLIIFLIYKSNKENISLLIFITIITILTSYYSIILLLGFIIYIILNYIEKDEIEKIRIEFIIFFTLFFFWSNFIIYKNAIIKNGINFFWQNIPNMYIENYFLDVNFYHLITSLGLLQLFFSFYIIYKYIVRTKNKNILLIISLFFSSTLLLILKLIPYKFAILSIGIFNIILFGIFWSDFFSTFKKTKFFNHESKVYITLIIILIFTQFLPTILIISSQNSYKKDYYENFKLLKDLKNDSIIISLPEEGHLITYFGNKKNVIDTDFLGIENINERISDIFSIYKKDLKIENLNILNKYHANYIIYTEKTKNYNITETNFIKNCFDLIINKNDFKLYEYNSQKCKIQTI